MSRGIDVFTKKVSSINETQQNMRFGVPIKTKIRENGKLISGTCGDKNEKNERRGRRKKNF